MFDALVHGLQVAAWITLVTGAVVGFLAAEVVWFFALRKQDYSIQWENGERG